MKKAALLLLFLTTGCATSPYLTDRARDAADIFTATYCANFGAKARIGPVHAGLYHGYDSGGLRAGEFKAEYTAPFGSIVDFDTTIYSSEVFHEYSLKTGIERGKLMDSAGLLGLSIGGPALPPTRPATWRRSIPYYTQVEVAAGVLVGARLGFNPGELVDFLIGWTTLDIFQDDIGLFQPPADGSPSPP